MARKKPRKRNSPDFGGITPMRLEHAIELSLGVIFLSKHLGASPSESVDKGIETLAACLGVELSPVWENSEEAPKVTASPTP